ncbi:hypothetical protein GCM10025886_05900 [Tetragenococcus halophilus subsp. flandriensis]|uniref:hypothetical protein n=1 Tax=Tetragenococcus halophilus TaxID=51669 RepID=UPI0023E97C62|nr:hypothetical protein [Tetragenococcus halophilus]GMA07439.1 hypothetical protein GCM10025886_05900 [Tetragenococcus halophilus subsp. flandriensis]
MIDNLISISKTLHCLQYCKYIEHGEGEPVGLIKIIESDYIDELSKDETFYFHYLRFFEPKNEEEKLDIRKELNECLKLFIIIVF